MLEAILTPGQVQLFTERKQTGRAAVTVRTLRYIGLLPPHNPKAARDSGPGLPSVISQRYQPKFSVDQ